MKNLINRILCWLGIKKCCDIKAVTSANKKFALIIGMEESSMFGSCPGALKDSETMTGIIKGYVSNDHMIKLTNSSATKKAVLSAMREQIAKVPEDGLFIMTYSGHGANQRFSTTGAEEADGKDEFLCLYDNYLIDNVLWNEFCKCKGRVFVIFDCCHSETMYRSPAVMTFEGIKAKVEEAEAGDLTAIAPRSGKAVKTNSFMYSRDSQPRIMCWSGCPDNTYSYGSASGGMFTNAIKAHLMSGSSYLQNWKVISADRALKRQGQVPKATKIGDFNVDIAVFQ